MNNKFYINKNPSDTLFHSGYSLGNWGRPLQSVSPAQAPLHMKRYDWTILFRHSVNSLLNHKYPCTETQQAPLMIEKEVSTRKEGSTENKMKKWKSNGVAASSSLQRGSTPGGINEAKKHNRRTLSIPTSGPWIKWCTKKMRAGPV